MKIANNKNPFAKTCKNSNNNYTITFYDIFNFHHYKIAVYVYNINFLVLLLTCKYVTCDV